MKTYTLAITEEQARVLVNACDFFSRIGIGQLDRVLDEFRFSKDVSPEKLDEARKFIDHAKFLLTGFPPNASHGIRSPQVKDIYRVAYDLQQVIRHRLAWDAKPEGGIGVHFDEPWRSSNEPLATITEKKPSV